MTVLYTNNIFITRIRSMNITFCSCVIISYFIMYLNVYVGNNSIPINDQIWLFIITLLCISLFSSDSIVIFLICNKLITLGSYFLLRKYIKHYAKNMLLYKMISEAFVSCSIILLLQNKIFYFSEITTEFSIVHSLYIIIPTLIQCSIFPFHAWLQNCIECPGYISAYLHSSTLLQIGLYWHLQFSSYLHPSITILLHVICYTSLIFCWFITYTSFDLKQLCITMTQAFLGVMLICSKVSNMTLLAHCVYKSIFFILTQEYYKINCGYSIQNIVGFFPVSFIVLLLINFYIAMTSTVTLNIAIFIYKILLSMIMITMFFGFSKRNPYLKFIQYKKRHTPFIVISIIMYFTNTHNSFLIYFTALTCGYICIVNPFFSILHSRYNFLPRKNIPDYFIISLHQYTKINLQPYYILFTLLSYYIYPNLSITSIQFDIWGLLTIVSFVRIDGLHMMFNLGIVSLAMLMKYVTIPELAITHILCESIINIALYRHYVKVTNQHNIYKGMIAGIVAILLVNNTDFSNGLEYFIFNSFGDTLNQVVSCIRGWDTCVEILILQICSQCTVNLSRAIPT